MKRRSFLGALGGIVAVWPRTGHGQRPALPMVGILGSGSPAPLFTTALADGLKESDYNEGRNVHLEYRWARGAYDMLPKLADELVSLRVNVLAAFGTPAAHAAKAASLKASPPIPVVFSLAATRSPRGWLPASTGRAAT